jgi:hypothetical protein
MAGSRTGTPTIWKRSVQIARLYQKLGASDMTAKLGAPYTSCIQALITCVVDVLATDDFVLQIDATAPLGPEDIGGP